MVPALALVLPLFWRFRVTAVTTSGIALVAVAIASCRPAPPPTVEAPNPLPPAAPGDLAPTPPDATPSATVPTALLTEWQPLSNVLLTFGSMTLTADRVRWDSGQTSPYTLVVTEDGYLLELLEPPTFYDVPNRYIKLIPKADSPSAANALEVAFYSDAAQLQQDNYGMYGSYAPGDAPE